MSVSMDRFCETQNGALRSIDLSKLYRLRQAEKPHHRARLATTRPAPSAAVERLQRLLTMASKEDTALVLRRRFVLVQTSAGTSKVNQRRDGGAGLHLRLQPLEARTYSVDSSNDARKTSRIEMELPFGMPRFVNVRTLKAMLGASPRDPLFRQAGSGWVICPDSFRVDIADSSRVFRLGKIQVLS